MVSLFFYYIIWMLRGKALEKTANMANIQYRKSRKALIENIPTPFIVTNQGLIPRPSTVDYVGLLEGGQFIAFDAKETKLKTRFDLKNIHDHQLEYLNFVESLQGIAFFLIHFTEIEKNKSFVTPLWLVNKWVEDSTRSSIPYDEFIKYCTLVNNNNYLSFLDTYDKLNWFKKNNPIR